MKYTLLSIVLISLPTSVEAQPAASNRIIGRCIVMTVRDGSQSLPDPPGCAPAQPTDRTRLLALSKWIPPFLELAYDEAELSLCSYRSCATDDRDVTIVVILDGAVNAGVTTYSTGSIEFRLTSGLIDFTAAAATSFTKEVVAGTKGEPSPQGFNWWLGTMQAFGGQACRASMPWPDARATTPEDFLTLVQAPGQSVYQLVFGHELAHLRSGGRCGVGAAATPLALEAACDRMTLDALSRRRGIMPVVSVAWLTALNFYESLQGAAAIGIRDAGKTVDFFPARDWRVRSDRLLDRWAELCKGGLGKGATCLPGWEAGVDEGRRLLKLAPPTACKPLPMISSSELPAEGSFCQSLKTSVEAVSSGFVKLRGAQTYYQDGDRAFSSTLKLPGARQCSVWQYSDRTAAFRCAMSTGAEGSDAEAIHAEVGAKVKACLPSWAIDEEQSGTRVKQNAISARSGGIAVRVVHSTYQSSGRSDVRVVIERDQ